MGEIDMGSEKRLRVLLFPWLAHGHITPYLHLGKQLSKRNLEVMLCSTPVNLKNIPNLASIQLVGFQLPPRRELPPHLHTTNGLPSHLMPTLKEAFNEARSAFTEILERHSPDVVIYDVLQPWAPEVAASLGIPAVLFMTFGAACISFFMHLGLSTPQDGEFPFPELYIRPYEEEAIKELTRGTRDRDRSTDGLDRSCSFILMRTSREIEGKYIDYLPRWIGKAIIPVGHVVLEGDQDDYDPVIEWLNQRAELSTVLVSFGSEYYLNDEDMGEIARGLELSGVNHVWVLRFPSGVGRSEGLCGGVGEKGMVVEWVPQRRVLAHPSIAGMVSHCGWGSVLEAVEAGVPIVAMPMQLDQPLNARLVKELRVGIEVVRDDSGRLQAEEIADVIRQVALGKSAVTHRNRVRKMRDVIRGKGEMYTDGVVNQLIHLCANKSIP